MSRKLSLTICLAIAFAVTAIATTQAQDQSTQEPDSVVPNLNLTKVVPQESEASLKQKASFLFGYNLASRVIGDFKSQGIELDRAKLEEGMLAALHDKELGMSPEEATSVLTAFRKHLQENQMNKLKALAEKNEQDGAAYIATFTKEEGVKMLDNGVAYKVVTAGTGPNPKPNQKVKVHYHGTLTDGTVFDSSISPPDGSAPNPIELQVARFVPGFSKTLESMKVGGKWKVAIPGSQAYKMQSMGPIGPNQTLLFDIELIGIVE